MHQRSFALTIRLTISAARIYAQSVIGVPMIGLDSPNKKRTAAVPAWESAFFMSVVRCRSYGRAGREAARLAGACCRSVNPSGSAHLFDRGLAEVLPINRSLTMDTHIPGASASARKPWLATPAATRPRRVSGPETRNESPH